MIKRLSKGGKKRCYCVRVLFIQSGSLICAPKWLLLCCWSVCRNNCSKSLCLNCRILQIFLLPFFTSCMSLFHPSSLTLNSTLHLWVSLWFLTDEVTFWCHHELGGNLVSGKTYCSWQFHHNLYCCCCGYDSNAACQPRYLCKVVIWGQGNIFIAESTRHYIHIAVTLCCMCILKTSNLSKNKYKANFNGTILKNPFYMIQLLLHFSVWHFLIVSWCLC